MIFWKPKPSCGSTAFWNIRSYFVEAITILNRCTKFATNLDLYLRAREIINIHIYSDLWVILLQHSCQPCSSNIALRNLALLSLATFDIGLSVRTCIYSSARPLFLLVKTSRCGWYMPKDTCHCSQDRCLYCRRLYACCQLIEDHDAFQELRPWEWERPRGDYPSIPTVRADDQTRTKHIHESADEAHEE